MTETRNSEQLARLQGMVQQLDRKVWSKPAFPSEDRPDIEALLPNIEINSNAPMMLLPHPDLVQLRESSRFPDLVSSGMAVSKEEFNLHEEKQIAEYNPLTRKIYLSEGALGVPDWLLKRFLAHEFATDTYIKPEFIPQEKLPMNRQMQTREQLQQIRKMGAPLKGRVELMTAGLSEFILIDGYLVAEVSGELASFYNEIYPTAFELITSEIDQRNGDIQYFENDIRKKRLQLHRNEQHPNFTFAVFKALELVDWRVLLHAFRQTDIAKTRAILNEQTPYGDGIFARLITDMENDETQIVNTLRELMKRGYRNK